jgi:uncharacterized membrane protein YhaH (DUF805 family)
MNAIDSVITCYQKAFNGKGRATRSEFWWFVLFNFVILYLFASSAADSPLFVVIYLGNLIVQMNAGFRRMHDVGKNGIFYFIPIINLLFAITEGDPEENKYGSPPIKLS